MSEYDNVVGGKLKLKGKALGVKGIAKKKKKHRQNHHHLTTGGNTLLLTTDVAEYVRETDRDDEKGEAAKYDDYLTPAERRYLEQWEKLDMQRLNKMASKSHRDRIQEFNQYLANLTEHYDIPKVGPG